MKSDESQNTMMVFYNELYVYLLDLMHRTINDMFSRGAVALVCPSHDGGRGGGGGLH